MLTQGSHFVRTLGKNSTIIDSTLKGFAARETLSGFNRYFFMLTQGSHFVRTLGKNSTIIGSTLKGFAARETLSGFNRYFFMLTQGSHFVRTLGLKLANAFGVNQSAAKESKRCERIKALRK
jgi:hypothetical protein